MLVAEPFDLWAFFVFQCRQTVFVILASHARSRVSSTTSAVEKYLVPFGGGCPSGRRSFAATKTGISCVWQFSTHAACSTVSRAGGCPSRARKWRWSSFTRCLYWLGKSVRLNRERIPHFRSCRTPVLGSGQLMTFGKIKRLIRNRDDPKIFIPSGARRSVAAPASVPLR